MKKIFLLILCCFPLSGCALFQTTDNTAEILAAYQSFNELMARRDAKVFENLKDNPAATIGYAFAANNRDVQAAKVFRIPQSNRRQSIAENIIRDIIKYGTYGYLGGKALDTLAVFATTAGSEYNFDSGGGDIDADIGNEWSPNITGDGNSYEYLFQPTENTFVGEVTE